MILQIFVFFCGDNRIGLRKECKIYKHCQNTSIDLLEIQFNGQKIK